MDSPEQIARTIPSLDRVVRAVSAGQVSEDTYVSLVRWLAQSPTRSEWNKTLRHWFLVLGSSLSLSGVIYFGAYNWSELGRFQKLGLLELILIGLFLGVLLRGLTSQVGQVLIVAASVMVGALLAVFGQVYQTGADSYLLFLTWSLLIVLWCLVGRSNVLWTLQFVLVNTTFCLWWFSHADWSRIEGFALAFSALNLFLGGLWGFFRSKLEWMSSGITEVLIATALTPLTFAGCLAIIAWKAEPRSLGYLAAALIPLMIFRHKQLATMVSVSAALLSLGTTCLILWLIGGGIFGILMIGVGILIQLGVIVRVLTGIQQRQKGPDQVVENTAVDEPTPQARGPQLLLPQSLSEQLNIPLAEVNTLYQHDDTLPWYVQALIGVGAWIATLFIVVFFFALISKSKFLLLLSGLALYVGSLYLKRKNPGRAFVNQSLLSLHLTSQLVIMYAIEDTLSGSEALAPLVGLGLFCVSIAFYDDNVGRFLFGCGVFYTTLWLVAKPFDEYGAVLVLTIVGAFLMWSSTHIERILLSKKRRMFLSSYRGLGASFLVCSVIPIFNRFGSFQQVLLSLGLLASCLWAARILKLPPQVLLGLSIFAVLTQSVPTIMAAVLGYGAGFCSRDSLMKSLALATLLGSGCFFYYSLEMTLMAKALTLIGSGISLLLLRLALGANGDRTESAVAF